MTMAMTMAMTTALTTALTMMMAIAIAMTMAEAIRRLALLSAILALLAACAVGPAYRPPSVALPARFLHAQDLVHRESTAIEAFGGAGDASSHPPTPLGDAHNVRRISSTV